MKKLFAIITLLIITLVISSCSSISLSVMPTSDIANVKPPTPNDALQQQALTLVDWLVQEDYTTIYEQFDDTLKQAVSAAKLEQGWQSLLDSMGAYQKNTALRTEEQSGYTTVVVTMALEKGLIDARVTYNPDGQIAGLFLTHTNQAEVPEYHSPSYVDQDSFTSQEVTVGSGQWALPGTLTLPKDDGPFPAIVLVHGSGPNDRDETIGPNKPFRDLAEGLASKGIAVLRYEKRTKQYPYQIQKNIDTFTVQEESIDDALAAVQLLRHTPGIDSHSIYVLGHSLGGMLAPRIAVQDHAIAGLIIAAGPTRLLEDIFIDQVTYLAGLDGAITPDENKQIEVYSTQAAQIKDPALSSQTPADELLGGPGAYWLDLRNYQPAQAAAELDIPIFILRGLRDYQVTEADLYGWQAELEGKSGIFLKQYPGLNHLMIKGIGVSSPAEYNLPGHVAQIVVRDIADFILKGSVSKNTTSIGDFMTNQEITRLILLLLPIFLIQLGLSIYCLVDLSRRKKTHGPRWLWAVLLVLGAFSLPSGLIISGAYLVWGRKEDDYGDDDSD